MKAARVFLRPIELDDVERLHRWHNDPGLYDHLGSSYWPVSRAAVEDWVRQKQTLSRQEVNLAICATDSAEHLGNIYLRNLDWVTRHGELHLFIGEAGQRSQGYGQAAVRLLVEHAFGRLGLQRLYLFVLEENRAAVHVYEKCGFRVEGRLRRHAFKRGAFRDVLVMGLCADDR